MTVRTRVLSCALIGASAPTWWKPSRVCPSGSVSCVANAPSPGYRVRGEPLVHVRRAVPDVFPHPYVPRAGTRRVPAVDGLDRHAQVGGYLLRRHQLLHTHSVVKAGSTCI